MPITQERFMTIIRGSKNIIYLHRAVKEALRNALVDDVPTANAVLLHSDDENAKQAISTLINRLNMLHQIFIEHGNSDNEELTAIILAEDIHFTRVANRNSRAKVLREKSRRDNGIMPRASEANLIPPAEHIPHITEPNYDFKNTPEYKRFEQDQIANWQNPNKTWPKHKIQPIIDREIKAAERIYGPLDLDIRAERERQLQLRLQAQTNVVEPVPQLKPSNWPTGHYAPDRRAILPTPEEFEKDADPNGDIL